jgi:hypothetical protein
MNKWIKTYWRARHIGNFNDTYQYEFDYAEKIKDHLALVKIEPEYIEDIKNPSEQVQLVAVKQNDDLFEFIINKGIEPSEQVQLAAVKQNGWLNRAWILNADKHKKAQTMSSNSIVLDF